MKYRTRIYYTEAQKSLMWDRWQKGASLSSIARWPPPDKQTPMVFIPTILVPSEPLCLAKARTLDVCGSLTPGIGGAPFRGSAACLCYVDEHGVSHVVSASAPLPSCTGA